MTHTEAMAMVEQYAPQQAGLLWDTTDHTGCDTAWAVADQYATDERDEAIAALVALASGMVPDEWEPHRPHASPSQ